MTRDIYPVQLMIRRGGTKPAGLSTDEAINILRRSTDNNKIIGGMRLDIIGIGNLVPGGSIYPIYSIEIYDSFLDDLRRGNINIPVLELIQNAPIPVPGGSSIFGYSSGNIPTITLKTPEELTYKDENNIRTYEAINYTGNINVTFENNFISSAIVSALPGTLYWNNNDDDYDLSGSGFYGTISEILTTTGLMNVEVKKGSDVAPLSDLAIAEFSISPTAKMEEIPANITSLKIIGINIFWS